MHDTRALLVGFAAGAILLLEGLQALNKWQENWILYRATCEGLRNEQHLFAEKAGPYAGLKPEAAQRLLAERTSSLVMAEHSKWVHARATRSRRRRAPEVLLVENCWISSGSSRRGRARTRRYILR